MERGVFTASGDLPIVLSQSALKVIGHSDIEKTGEDISLLSVSYNLTLDYIDYPDSRRLFDGQLHAFLQGV